MIEKQGHNKYRTLVTESSLSTLYNKSSQLKMDVSVLKTIKSNDVEHLIGKQGQNNTSNTPHYDEQAQIMNTVIQMRRKYDDTKQQQQELSTRIQFLNKEKEILEQELSGLNQFKVQAESSYSQVASKHKKCEDEFDSAQYNQKVYQNVCNTLKNDILCIKKRCFDSNISLIRIKTQLRSLRQRSNNKQHLKSKTKVVLESLHSTVKMRQERRSSHLQQVEALVQKKKQNSQFKIGRQKQLQLSLYLSSIERMPQQQQLVKKYYSESLLRTMLRLKMTKLLQQYKQVQNSFNEIKKQTRIKSASEFIDHYLKRDEHYGQLLESISKKQQTIAAVKQQYEELTKINKLLQQQQALIDQAFQDKHKAHSDNQIHKIANSYNNRTRKVQELKVMTRIWINKIIHSLQAIKDINKVKVSQDGEDKTPIKQQITKGLNILKSIIDEEQLLAVTKQHPSSDMQTSISGQRIQLSHLRKQSALSEQYSIRNCRVLTFASEKEEERQQFCDDISEHNYLRYNRRMMKRHNLNSIRARIKTKMSQYQ